ncbi:mitochondrial adenylate kinase [Andalucia godoyi]|uniref:Mitochondrial adenylate kinase n=1 Tax=Andalucia godoyi TaxID=505711 RepID=A0A8K0F4C6_ANDGO|nr:mitochondrial adenylate kinase [Andalucia godoyi]|eukprot:ANDGO_08006.mRNA.1 mitochondrial adenylate kinase
MLSRSVRLLFTGAPGVGKGTYASRVSEKIGLPHISAGDLLRAEVATGSSLGKELSGYLSKGLLAPPSIVNAIVFQRLKRDDCQHRGYILDGFPRSVAQADEMHHVEDIQLDSVINFHQDYEVIIQKLAGRRVCSSCGTGYNLSHVKKGRLDMPPLAPRISGVCDSCGGELVQRSDDNPEVVFDRLKVYENSTQPLIDYYKKAGILLEFEVDGTPKQCMPRLVRLIEGVSKNEKLAA